jgi:hypothetical protein
MSHAKVKVTKNTNSSGSPNWGNKKVNSDYLLNNPNFIKCLQILLWIIFIILLFYIIIKILKKTIDVDRKLEAYEEEKEAIIKIKTNENNLIRRLTKMLKPKENNELVRFYYTKYLKLCLKNKINILYSDTSKEINGKAKDSFNNENINILRNIYIKARYGGEEIDDKLLKKFLDYFKKIKN